MVKSCYYLSETSPLCGTPHTVYIVLVERSLPTQVNPCPENPLLQAQENEP